MGLKNRKKPLHLRSGQEKVGTILGKKVWEFAQSQRLMLLPLWTYKGDASVSSPGSENPMEDLVESE